MISSTNPHLSLDAVAEVVLHHVRGIVPEGLGCELTLDTSLYEVGLDSLTRMNVVNHLEEAFGVRFTEEALYDLETCRDLVQYIGAKSGCKGATGTPEPAAAPAQPPQTPAAREVLPEHWDVTKFPECIA
jgi:acyl carrier protein